MDLFTLLLNFERDPKQGELVLEQEEHKNPSILAVQLCELSRPSLYSPALTAAATTPGSQPKQLVMIRLLALSILQGVIERNWNVPTGALKRQQNVQNYRVIGDSEKRMVQEMLLSDVSSEITNHCVAKRAQLIACIAKYEWMRWAPVLFQILLPVAVPNGLTSGANVPSSPTTSTSSNPQLLRLFYTLHCVLKVLANQRIGSQIEGFRKIVAVELYPRLRHHLSIIFQHTVNLESMPDHEAELATWICKCINSLIRGSNSIQELPISSHFEIVIASLSLKPRSAWTSRLVRTLRKTCLTTMKSHPALFNDFFFAAFAEKTIQHLQASFSIVNVNEDPSGFRNNTQPPPLSPSDHNVPSSPYRPHPQQRYPSSEAVAEQQEQLLIFCYAFWTEALLQKQYQVQTNHVIDRGLPLVTKAALVHLRLTKQDLEEWQSLGGEQFCYEDGDIDALLVKPGKEDTVRRAAKKFLQTCFDQPLAARADVCLNEIFSNHYGDPLAVEAAFLAVQLCSFRLHSKWHFDEFLKTRLLPCLVSTKVPTTSSSGAVTVTPLEQACLARRACCVIQSWIADISIETLPLVYSSLFQIIHRSAGVDPQIPEEDLGVCISAMECLLALMSEACSNAVANTSPGHAPGDTPSSPASSSPHLLLPPLEMLSSQISIPLLSGLYDKLALSESKQKLLVYIEQILVCHSTSLQIPLFGRRAVSTKKNDGKKKLKHQLSLVLCQFIPFVVKNVHSMRSGGRSDGESPALILHSCLDLARVCIKLLGFAEMDPTTKQVCVDLVKFCLQNPIHIKQIGLKSTQASSRSHTTVATGVTNMEEDIWANLLLVCLKTSNEMFPPLIEILTYETCLKNMRDMKLKCQLADSASLLWMFTKNKQSFTDSSLEFSSIARDLSNYFLNANNGHTLTETTLVDPSKQPQQSQLQRGVIARTADPQDEPFTLLHVCRCLDMLLKTHALPKNDASLKVSCWDRILNYSKVDEAQDDSFHIDSRDVIERLSVSARIILAEYSFFSSIESAEAFARLCNKYLDAVGFVPSEAPWRRRLWTSALLLTLSRCEGASESAKLISYTIHACAFICREMQQLVGMDGTVAVLNGGDDSRYSLIELPCFTSVDDENLNYEVDFDSQRREHLFMSDEFLKVNFRSAFQKVWKMLLERFGNDGLQRITGTLNKTMQIDLNTLLSNTSTFISASAPSSPRTD